MSRFFLIRHGMNDLVGRALAGCRPGVHLNAEGQRQAYRLVERLAGVPITAVYSSPLERCLETAAPLAQKLSLEVQVDGDLREVEFGDWTGKSLEELKDQEQWRHFNSFRSGTPIPGGEMMIAVQARMIAALDRLRRQHASETVAVFSHGDLIKAAVAHYAGIHLDLFQRLEIDPASITIIEIAAHGPAIVCVNNCGDL
jgi:probable phosphomutase (TIGR03848 family)